MSTVIGRSSTGDATSTGMVTPVDRVMYRELIEISTRCEAQKE